MSAAFFEGLGDALQIGEQTAKDIVTIAACSDMGDIREDATAEAVARLMQQVPRELYGVALANTVKMLAVHIMEQQPKALRRSTEPGAPSFEDVI